MKKQMLTVILTIAMVFCLLPAAAFAEEVFSNEPEEIILLDQAGTEEADEIQLEENTEEIILQEAEGEVSLLEDTSYIIDQYEEDGSYILYNLDQLWFVMEPGGWLKLIGYKGVLSGELEIPTEVNGYQVQTIGEGAFENASDITGTLHVPSIIQEIGRNAFKGCTGLTGLDLKYGLKTIGDGAFEGCEGLTGDLFIPNSVEYLGGDCFAWCTGFTGTIHFPENENCKNIPGHMFYHSGNFTGNIVIPDNITSIDSNAFHFCDFNNATITLSKNLTFIGHWAFFACEGLVGNLVIPEGVTEIDYGAFYGCRGFTGDLILPDSCRRIAYQAFDDCRGFNGTLHLPELLQHIGSRAFYDDNFTGPLYIPDSVEEIGEEAFAFCRKFDGAIHLPENANYKEIAPRAFGYCENLKGTLSFPANITKIGEEAFRECQSLSGNLVIPEGITEIGIKAFMYCSGLNGTLTLPGTLRDLGYGAFQNCSGFKGNLVIPGSLTSIGQYTFSYCTGFDGELDLGTGVKSLGESAFEGCRGLNGDLVIPKNITYVGNKTFYGCSGFNGTLSLSSELTSIENDAFESCENLTGAIVLPDKLESLGAYAFYDCKKLTGNLRIPESCTRIYDYCFGNCKGLTGTLTIPATVTTLRSYAFKGAYFHTIRNSSAQTIRVENHLDAQYSPINYIIEGADVDDYWYCNAAGERVSLIETGTYTLHSPGGDTPVELKKITMDKKTAEFAIKDSLQLNVIFDPENASDKTVTWKSSDPSVASVNADGLVTALKYGSATITATSKANSKLKATCKVQTRFRDVLRGDVPDTIFTYIYWGADNGIIGGYNDGNFGRNDSCTRAQFSTMIWKMAGKPKAAKKASAYFSDVSDSTAIAWAYENKIIGGYSDGTFKPSNNLTRSNFVIMLWKWAGKPGIKKGAQPKSFKDVPSSNAAYKAVQWASSYGIIGGYSDGSFGVKDNCTRQQIVTMLYKYTMKYLN